jgi:hypothetical protein
MIFQAKTRAPAEPASSTARPILQRKCACGGKLAINQPNDRFEREADRIADQVISGGSASHLSAAANESVQRDEEEKKKPPKPNNYEDAAKKIGDAVQETAIGKQLKAKAEELGKDFLSSVEGKVIAGSSLAGALTAIIATNSELPIPIPEIPLDFIKPGLKAKLTYEGPTQKPTNVGLTLTSQSGLSVSAGYTKTAATPAKPAEEKLGLSLSFPLGGSPTKKKAPSDTDKRAAEIAQLRAEKAQRDEERKTPAEKKADEDFLKSYLHFKANDPLNPLNIGKKNDDLLLMRSAAGEAASSTAPPVVRDTLRESGQPLDRDTRSFMEERFGYDFGRVRIHNDAQAAESARAVNAHAYTVGAQIAFDSARYSPTTPEGRRLLAHELAHVIQQGCAKLKSGEARSGVSQAGERGRSSFLSSNVVAGAIAGGTSTAGDTVQRKPAPPSPTKPFYQEVLDSLAVERKQIITFSRSQMIPDSVPLLEKLVTLCEAIERGVNADVSKALADFLGSNTEHLPLSVPSDGLVAEMAARMLALGLDAESQKLRRWSVARDRQISPGYYEGFSAEIYAWERIEERLLQQIPEAGGTEALKSLDTLLLLFGQLHRERFSLSAEEISKDQKRRGELFDNPFAQNEKTISVYAAELVRLMRETFIGVQSAFQVVLDQAAEDLAQGKGGAMLQSAKDRLENKLLGLIEPKEKDQAVTGVAVETTRSEFKTGGGTHFDYFAKTEAAKKKRSVKIDFYDVEQMPSMASEMQADFGQVFLARRRQIALLEEIYGLQKDDKGKPTAETKENAAAIAKLGSSGLHLHSDDDWRKFVKEKFELRERTDGSEKALVAVINLLEKYLRVFTTHTPYNIEDFGDNLLTKTFPRDLAGRLIHDCGVYALRIAYILSLLRDHPKLHLRFRYIVMPLHVGLIITGDGLPIFLANNDSIARYTGADTAALRKEWNKLDETGAEAPPKKPATEARFAGELAADSFISGVDLPYKEIEVTKGTGSPAAMKAQMWAQYTRDVAPSADKLFGPSVKDPKSPNYQFYLRYLNLLTLLKNHYNQWIVPFWNVTALELWNQYKERITRAFTSWQQAAGAKAADAKKTYDAVVAEYDTQLRKAYKPVQDATKPITAEQTAMQAYIKSHPEVFASGVEVKSAARVEIMFYDAFGIVGSQWDEAIFRHLNDLKSGSSIEAPFAKPENKLFPLG